MGFNLNQQLLGKLIELERLFIVCTFDCSFDHYEETIEKFVNQYGDGIVIDYDLIKLITINLIRSIMSLA